MSIKNEFKFVPDENRVFSTYDIAAVCGVCNQTVRNVAIKLGFESTTKSVINGRKAFWSYDTYKAVKDFIENHIQKKAEFEKKKQELDEQREKSLEELKREHPLVTDERCFNLNWWPDTVPVCFKEVTSW